MASCRFLAFLALISSHVFLGFSRGLDSFLQGTDSIVDPAPGQIPPCLQKILPCQPYIKSPGAPSPMCCLPLKQILVTDQECLCSFFNNADLLKALNVTQSQALQLPKACGVDVDPSVCNHAKASSPSPIPSTEAPPPPEKASNGSSSPSKPSSSNRNYGISWGLAVVSSFVILLLSTF